VFERALPCSRAPLGCHSLSFRSTGCTSPTKSHIWPFLPCASHQVSLIELRKHGVYQRRLLDAAAQLVKPGGVLVYST